MAHSLNIARKHYSTLIVTLMLLFYISPVTAEDNALVIRGKTAIFEEVLKGISDDIDGELSLNEVIVNGMSSQQDLEKMFKRYRPRIIILMGNKAVNLYSEFQAKNRNLEF